MASTLTHVAAVLAGLAIIASPMMISRKGLLPGLAAGVVLAVAAALLITAARAIG